MNPITTAEKKRVGTGASLLRLILKLTLIGLGVFLILRFVFGVRILYGNAGYPSVRDGDLVIYSIYERAPPARGKLVVWEDPEGRVSCSRVICAEEGHRVDLTDQGVLVDGDVLAEDSFYPLSEEEFPADFPVTLSEREVILLNDYRPDIRDSRTWGAIERDCVRGTVVLLVRWRGF